MGRWGDAMFTGIVEGVGRVIRLSPASGGSRRLRLAVPAFMTEGCDRGASLCVSGVCLTVADRGPEWLEFDVVRETLERTTLGRLSHHEPVNLERSLAVGGRLDGHFVQGHIDGTAQVTDVTADSREHVLGFRPERPEYGDSIARYVIPKGSIAIDGVSLTVARVEGDSFSVALIPTTLERTTLAALKVGDRVNLETDIIARTVVYTMEKLGGGRRFDGASLELLQKAGLA